MANQALDTIRKSLRQGLTDKQRRTLMHDRFILLKRRSNLNTKEILILESWTGTYKDLELAYNLKETFYEVWDAENKGVAMERLKQWQDRIPEHLSPAFKDLLTALKNWQKEIFAYFDHRITNAYTESLNGLIRVMNRLGRDYSFEALRAKILYTEGIQKIRKSTYRRQSVWKDALQSSIYTIMEDAGKNYGVKESLGAHIPILIRLLEEDKL